MKETLNCEEASIYDCYKDMSGMQVLQSAPPLLFALFFYPSPDNDFFPESVKENSYDLANR